jgi:hypothetical protein
MGGFLCFNARIECCAYPVLNGDESSIFCISFQVAERLATTFLRDHLPEPACPSDRVIRAGQANTKTSSSETYLISHETPNTENAGKPHSLDET